MGRPRKTETEVAQEVRVLGRPIDNDDAGAPEAINEGEGPTVVKLTIPAEVYAEYAETATKQGLTPAELMTHRLTRCKLHSSIRSLYFSEAQLRQLEAVLQKRPIESADQALAIIMAAFAVKIGDFEPIPLSVYQAKRIYLGAYGGLTPQDHLRKIVESAVARATGA